MLVTDITERRRVERALKASEVRFRAVVDHAGIGIALCDTTGAFVRVNTAFAEFVGSTPEQCVGVPSASLSPPEDAPITREALRRLREDGEASVTVEKRNLHPDGSIDWGSLTLSAIETEERGAGLVLGLVQDITAQKESEAALEAREAHFRQAQELQAVGRLAGGVAHDFNHILAAIASYAELMASEIPPGSGMAQDLREIRLAAERGARLTRRLLSFSRQQPVRRRRLDVRAILREFEPFLQRLIGSEVGLAVHSLTPEHPSYDPVVRMDRGQLEQVVMNLVVNARDAMLAGGTVTVTVGIRAIEGTVVDSWEASALPRPPEGCYVHLSVRDTGIGMDETVQRRALEPFFSTKEGRGTGLGLSTVYGIVTQAGGALRIDSALGVGTCVDVLLPLDAAVARSGSMAVTPASSSSIGTSPVAEDGSAEQRLRRLRPVALVVDDERPIAHAAGRLLEGRGWSVEVSCVPESALRTLVDRAPEIDHLLTDIRMPGICRVTPWPRTARSSAPVRRSCSCRGSPRRGRARRPPRHRPAAPAPGQAI